MADVNGRRGPAPIIPQTPEQAAVRDSAAGLKAVREVVTDAGTISPHVAIPGGPHDPAGDVLGGES